MESNRNCILIELFTLSSKFNRQSDQILRKAKFSKLPLKNVKIL